MRTRCERRPTDEEAILAALTGELREAVAQAKVSLKAGLDEAQAVLAEIRAKHAPTLTPALTPTVAQRPQPPAHGTRRAGSTR